MIIKPKHILEELKAEGVGELEINEVRAYMVNHQDHNLVIRIKNDSDSRNMVTTPAKVIEVCDQIGNNKFKVITLWHTKH